MTRVLFSFLFIVLLSTGAVAASVTETGRLEACAGDNNWPPMSYQIDKGGQVDGISAALLGEIITSPGALTVTLRPWARCIFEVESHSKADIAMSMFKTTEREKVFLFSDNYHNLTPSYLFSTNRFSQAPILTLSDLNKFNVCSLHGAATQYTHLPAAKIESGANSYTSLINKIDQNHCDIVVDMGEVLTGLAILGQFPQNSTTYQVNPLPENTQIPVYFAVSKNHPRAKQLITMLNMGLNTLSHNGKMKAIIMRYRSGTSLPMLILPSPANSSQRNTVSLVVRAP